MKRGDNCPICGNDKFYAHQKVLMDVVVDNDLDYISDGEVYEAERPYGPFTCTLCRTEFDGEDFNNLRMTSGPTNTNWGKIGYKTGKFRIPTVYTQPPSEKPTKVLTVRFPTLSGAYYIDLNVIASPQGAAMYVEVNKDWGVQNTKLFPDLWLWLDGEKKWYLYSSRKNTCLDKGESDASLAEAYVALGRAIQEIQAINEEFVIPLNNGEITVDRVLREYGSANLSDKEENNV